MKTQDRLFESDFGREARIFEQGVIVEIGFDGSRQP